jgi:hypothetical protein
MDLFLCWVTAGDDGCGVFAKEENVTLAVTFLVFVANQHYKSSFRSHYGWVDYRWYGVQEIKVLGRSLI